MVIPPWTSGAPHWGSHCGCVSYPSCTGCQYCQRCGKCENSARCNRCNSAWCYVVCTAALVKSTASAPTVTHGLKRRLYPTDLQQVSRMFFRVGCLIFDFKLSGWMMMGKFSRVFNDCVLRARLRKMLTSMLSLNFMRVKMKPRSSSSSLT